MIKRMTPERFNELSALPADCRYGPERELWEALVAERERLVKAEAELRIKSEFIRTRQCPDHSGKWERGRCLQCEVERLSKELIGLSTASLAGALRALPEIQQLNHRAEAAEAKIERVQAVEDQLRLTGQQYGKHGGGVYADMADLIQAALQDREHGAEGGGGE